MSTEKLSVFSSTDNDSPHAADGSHAFQPLTEQTFTSTFEDGARTVQLKLSARSQRPGAPPTLLATDAVCGSVVLSLTKSANIKSVSVEVVGTLAISAGADVRYQFLKLKKELWSRQNAGTGGLSSPGGTGSTSWPFALELPKTVRLKHGTPDECPLPASFTMRRGRATITYRVLAIIKHGLFSSVYTAGTNVNFVPLIQPGPPSVARQVAYEERQPLLGPDDDPTGWHTLEPVTVRGKIFGDREIAVDLTLSIALPLSYTRGTSCPVWLVISSSDSQALELLSSVTAPIVRLRRTVEDRYMLSPLELGQVVDMTTAVPVYQEKMYPDMLDNIQQAVWWPISSRTGEVASVGRRVLQGEIHLRPTLPPSFHLGYFKNRYSVCLYPPTAASFTVLGAKASTVLQEIPVELATLYADGPRHVTYSAVEYNALPGEDGGKKPAPDLLDMY